MSFPKRQKILIAIIGLFLLTGAGIEVAARSLVGFSPFIDPFTALRRVGVYQAPNTEVELSTENLMTDFAVQDNTLYITDDTKHLRIVDISDPAHPRQIADPILNDYSSIEFVSGKYIALTQFPKLEPGEKPQRKTDKIGMFDISDPRILIKVGEYEPQCEKLCTVYDTRLVGDTLYAFILEMKYFNGPLTKAGIHVIDIQDDSSFEKRAEILVPKQELSERRFQFDVTQNKLAISWGNQVFLFSQQGKGSFELVSNYQIPQSESLACQDLEELTLHEDTAYLIEQYGETKWCGQARLRILDIANPASPRELDTYDFPYNVGEVEVKNRFAFIANRARGMRVLDISDPSAPQEVAHYTRFVTPLYQEIWQMEVEENYAYVVGHQVLGHPKRIDIVDISGIR